MPLCFNIIISKYKVIIQENEVNHAINYMVSRKVRHKLNAWTDMARLNDLIVQLKKL